MTVYSIKQLAILAGVSVRTLHYYDQISLLKPASHSASGYRQYGQDSVIMLQQILFFRELEFSLDEIKEIISSPGFNVIEALQAHRILLNKKAERIQELMSTVDKTIKKLKGETKMNIKDYYKGFSNEQIEGYRKEARERWGEKVVQDSETRVSKMGQDKFGAIQAEGSAIFQAISDNMPRGFDSRKVQELVSDWRTWLENFSHYSDEAVLGLGQMYSQDPRFAAFFSKFHKDLPEFMTRAIEFYGKNKSAKK